MEMRFSNGEEMYHQLVALISERLRESELIPKVAVKEERKEEKRPVQAAGAVPEPFETKRLEKLRATIAKDSPYERKYPERERKIPVSVNTQNTQNQAEGLKEEPGEKTGESVGAEKNANVNLPENGKNIAANIAGKDDTVTIEQKVPVIGMGEMQQVAVATENLQQKDTLTAETGTVEVGQWICLHRKKRILLFMKTKTQEPVMEQAVQQTLYDLAEQREHSDAVREDSVREELKLLSKEARPQHRIIGQLFDTYWLVEFQDQFYMIDQHAAHEKCCLSRP